MMFPSKHENLSVSDPPAWRIAKDENDSVLAEVLERFYRSPYQELHHIVCDFHDGVLTLRGSVPSAFLKQIAQSIVFSMERIDAINNRLEVAKP